MTDPLTDAELQGLRNLGNDEERAADEITRLRAEVEGLTRKCNALTLSNEARGGMLSELRAGADAAREAAQTLASERAANALLTAEVESLREYFAADRSVSAVLDEVSPGLSTITCGHHDRLVAAMARREKALAAIKELTC